jgi:hypothetical protein
MLSTQIYLMMPKKKMFIEYREKCKQGKRVSILTRVVDRVYFVENVVEGANQLVFEHQCNPDLGM